MASTEASPDVVVGLKQAPTSAIETPQHTGDAGHGLSTDNASKGAEDNSNEVAHDGAMKAEEGAEEATAAADGVNGAQGDAADVAAVAAGNLNQVDVGADTGSNGDVNADVVARTGSTALPPQLQTAEQARDAEIDMEIAEMQPWNGHNRQHHLLRHSLGAEERGNAVLHHFGADIESVADAAKLIKKMSQRDLQAKFKCVYGTKTFSNNNNWLRRKLFEAIGMDPGKSATKKATQTGPRRRRNPSGGIKATSITSTRKTRPPARYARRSKAEVEEEQHHVAEALLALADFACDAELNGNDGLVPGRDEMSEGGLSWSGQRDVPAFKQEAGIGGFAGFDTQLPPAPPLQHTQSFTQGHDSRDANDVNDGMGSMMEYFSMMQRLMMQSPENHQMVMQMMSAQPGVSPSHQSQMIQQMQQMQQIQQMQMLMALQNNPALMDAFVQAHQNGDTGHSGLAHDHAQPAVVGHPDLFRRA